MASVSSGERARTDLYTGSMCRGHAILSLRSHKLTSDVPGREIIIIIITDDDNNNNVV